MKPLRKARLHHIRIFHNQQNIPSPAAKNVVTCSEHQLLRQEFLSMQQNFLYN